MRYIFIDKRFIVKYIKLNQKDVVFFDNKCIENISFHFIVTLPIPFHKFIRSHTILNNLQTLVGNIPLVMLFPGTYNNQSLYLFDRIKDENYYRAHNLNEYKI